MLTLQQVIKNRLTGTTSVHIKNMEFLKQLSEAVLQHGFVFEDCITLEATDDEEEERLKGLWGAWEYKDTGVCFKSPPRWVTEQSLMGEYNIFESNLLGQ